MCSAGGAAIAGQATGGLVSAYGNIQDGVMKQKYYQDLASTNELNAQFAEKTGAQNASLVQDEAAQNLKSLHDQGKTVEGAQRVALAANGIGGGSATAEDIARDTMTKEQKDEMAVRYSADMKAWQIKNEASFKAWDLRNQARSNVMAGDMAKSAAGLNATSSLLGAATQVADSSSRMDGSFRGKS